MEQQHGDINYLIARIESLDLKVDKILVQTTETNGRVNGHDKDIDALKKHVDVLREDKDLNKGRDRVIYIVLGAIGMVAMSLAAIFLKK